MPQNERCVNLRWIFVYRIGHNASVSSQMRYNSIMQERKSLIADLRWLTLAILSNATARDENHKRHSKKRIKTDALSRSSLHPTYNSLRRLIAVSGSL